MNILDKDTPLNGASPWALPTTVTVTDKPIWFSAFGLGDDDKICVRKIMRSSEGTGFSLTKCGTDGPDTGAITAREEVDRCGVKLCICKGQTGAAIMEPGEYEFVASGANVTAKLVTATAVDWLLTCCPPEPCKTC